MNNYRKFGFKPAYAHWRYRGIISGYIATDLRDLKEVDFQQLCAYDSLYFPGDRSNFLRTWIEQPHGQGYAIIEEEELLGYGVIRQAQDGFKIAPLFAQSREIAEKLFLSLATYAEGKNIYLDVPSINQQAISLAESYQMISTFECIRMYTAAKPDVNYNNIFAITSLELG